MSVVVGYVPDSNGLLAGREAAQQALWRDTEVVVVNVVDAAGYVRPTAADERTLDAVAGHLKSRSVPFSIRQLQSAERVSDVILKISEETDAELIVLGVKRRSAVARAVLGSTSERVLEDARCPVMLVRAEHD